MSLRLGPSIIGAVKFSIPGKWKNEDTKETPKVSHFAKLRGNTGKSTARIARTVMSIIWALYTVKDIMNGNLGRLYAFPFPFTVTFLVSEKAESCGEGRGDVTSRRGNNESSAIVGMEMRMERVMGELAKRVMERRRGRTRSVHWDVKPFARAGKRVLSDA